MTTEPTPDAPGLPACDDPTCGCKDPAFTEPMEALEFLSGRFKHAGVSHGVALHYARDIDAILAARPLPSDWVAVRMCELAERWRDRIDPDPSDPYDDGRDSMLRDCRKELLEALAAQPSGGVSIAGWLDKDGNYLSYEKRTRMIAAGLRQGASVGEVTFGKIAQNHDQPVFSQAGAAPSAPAEGGDYSACCDTPAYCSSVRRCTAKDSRQPPSAASVSERARDDLHVAICQAVALMNMEPMTTTGLLQAHDILRKAIS